MDLDVVQESNETCMVEIKKTTWILQLLKNGYVQWNIKNIQL